MDMNVESDLLKDVEDLYDGDGSGGEDSKEEDDEMAVDECIRLDCYPYSFSPLLLFAPGSYFDKG